MVTLLVVINFALFFIFVVITEKRHGQVSDFLKQNSLTQLIKRLDNIEKRLSKEEDQARLIRDILQSYTNRIAMLEGQYRKLNNNTVDISESVSNLRRERFTKGLA